jgi:hypothetical protein
MSKADKARCLAMLDAHHSKAPAAAPWSKPLTLLRPPASAPKLARKRAELPAPVRTAAQRLVDAADMRSASESGLPPALRDASPMALKLLQSAAGSQSVDATTRALEAARDAFESLQSAAKGDPRFVPHALQAAAVLVRLAERLAPKGPSDA